MPNLGAGAVAGRTGHASLAGTRCSGWSPQPAQRLAMDTLAALCDILDCTPNDLIEIETVNPEVRKTAGADSGPGPAVRRTSIRKPKGL